MNYRMKEVLTATFIMLTLLSCSSDQEDVADKRLVNTKWQTRDWAYEMVYGGTAFDVYEFTSATEVDNYTLVGTSKVDFYGTFTYELSYPNLIIHASDGDRSYTFANSGAMTRDGFNEYAFYREYIRQ